MPLPHVQSESTLEVLMGVMCPVALAPKVAVAPAQML